MPDDYGRFNEDSKKTTNTATGLLFKTEVIARNTDRIVEDVQKHIAGTRTVYTHKESVYSISGDMSADDIMRESRRLHTGTPEGGYVQNEERWKTYETAKERGRGNGVDFGNEVTYVEPEYRTSDSESLLPKRDTGYIPEPSVRERDSIRGRDTRSFFEAHSAPNSSEQPANSGSGYTYQPKSGRSYSNDTFRTDSGDSYTLSGQSSRGFSEQNRTGFHNGLKTGTSAAQEASPQPRSASSLFSRLSGQNETPLGQSSPLQMNTQTAGISETVNPLKTGNRKYEGWPPKPHDDKSAGDKLFASSSENRWLKPKLKTTVYGDKPIFYAGAIKTATDENSVLKATSEKAKKAKEAQEKAAAAVRETKTNGNRSLLHTATGRAVAKNKNANDLTERARRKRATRSTTAKRFASLTTDDKGKKKLSTATGTIIGQSIRTVTSKDKTKTTKTVITTSVKDGKLIKSVDKQTKKLGLRKTRMFTKGPRKLMTGTSVVVGGANSFAKGIQDGDTSEFAKTAVKHTTERVMEKPVQKVRKAARRTVLKAIKKAFKFVVSMFKKAIMALVAIASPIVIAVILAVVIILSLCIWGFSVDGSKEDWDKYSNYICAVEEGLQDDISETNPDTIEIKGQSNIAWKGLFSLAQTFYDGDGDFDTIVPVLEWAYSSDNAGLKSYTTLPETGLSAEEQENPALVNTRNPSLARKSNHLYSIDTKDGKTTVTIYGYNHILKDFVKSDLWKDRTKNQKTPKDITPYLDADEDDTYSRTIDSSSDFDLNLESLDVDVKPGEIAKLPMDEKTREKWLGFDNGLPTSISEAKKVSKNTCVVVEVPIWTGKEESTMKISVHKKLAADVKEIFKEMADAKFPVEKGYTGGLDVRMKSGGNGISNHSYGTAIDINYNYNPWTATQATNAEYACERVAPIWKKHGWKWGGDYKGTKDLMHFEFLPR